VGGLLLLSFARISRVNPGFSASHVLLLPLESVQRTDPARTRMAVLDLVDRLAGVAGVEAVGAAEWGVLGRPWTVNAVRADRPNEPIETTATGVTHGFLETMRIPLLAGRTFERRDIDAPDATAIVVNESFARQYFGDPRPVGRPYEGALGVPPRRYEVVGVVGDAKYDLRELAAPTIYIPVRSGGVLHVRVRGDAAAVAGRLREEVRAASPLLRTPSVTTQISAIDQTLLRERLLAMLAGFFAAVGLALVGVGLYGVLSYSVEQRTREIGIRVALGSGQMGVVRTVLADAGGAAAIGAVCGLAGGLYLSRFVAAMLFEITALDFWSLVLPLATLLCAAFVAAVLPALRAARVDPVVALRYE